MNNLFVKKIKLVSIGGKIEEAPIYGNFCPRCKTSSDNVYCHGDGLLNCRVCDHIFTIQDMTKTIRDFWKKKGCV